MRLIFYSTFFQASFKRLWKIQTNCICARYARSYNFKDKYKRENNFESITMFGNHWFKLWIYILREGFSVLFRMHDRPYVPNLIYVSSLIDSVNVTRSIQCDRDSTLFCLFFKERWQDHGSHHAEYLNCLRNKARRICLLPYQKVANIWNCLRGHP